MTADAGRAAEAARQQALVAAVFGAPPEPAARLREDADRLRRGLTAYRANGETIAARALAASYPTAAALIGDADFAALARALWRVSPPTRGDLAHWGHDLPAFIEAQRDLDPWPFLADAARLDLAVRRCEAAADATLEPHTLALLAQTDLDALRLQLLPCVQVLAGRWPIGRIHAAHRVPSGAGPESPHAPHALHAMHAAIAACTAETVVVTRVGWRADVRVIDEPAVAAWMQSLAAGHTLDRALDAAHAHGPFDVDAWLVQALQQGWLWRACASPSPEDIHHDTDLA